MKKYLVAKNKITVLVVVLLSGCAGSYKPTFSPGQPIAKIEYSAYLKGTLSIAGELKCSSFLGLPNNGRALTQIIFDGKTNDKVQSVEIPASENQVFMANTQVPQNSELVRFWFKFPVKANKLYKVSVIRVEGTKLLGYFDTFNYLINITDELGHLVNFETLSMPNRDKQCETSL